MKNPIDHVRSITPLVWLTAAAVVGLVFLMWHQFSNDDDDKAWTDVDQPPAVADFPMLPATGPTHGSGRPLECSNPFRGRQAFPGILDVSFGLHTGGGC